MGLPENEQTVISFFLGVIIDGKKKMKKLKNFMEPNNVWDSQNHGQPVSNTFAFSQSLNQSTFTQSESGNTGRRSKRKINIATGEN